MHNSEGSSAIHSPLTLNPNQTRFVLSQLGPDSPHVPVITSTQSTNQLCLVLSQLLSSPDLTWLIASTYRSILFHLCALWLDETQNTEAQLGAICDLVQVHEELFPLLYDMLRRPDLLNGPLTFVLDFEDPSVIDHTRLQRLLLAYYRILQINRQLPGDLQWSLLPLSRLMWTAELNVAARVLAIRCYALQTGMGEGERENLEHQLLRDAYSLESPLDYGVDLEGRRQEVDVWIMPFVELQRVQERRKDLLQKQEWTTANVDGIPLPPVELSPRLVNVEGILLFRSMNSGTPGSEATQSSLIPTPTTTKALRSLATQLSLRLPSLLTSPPSSGKSLVIHHLAHLLHPGEQNQLVNIHLADTSLDPRSLLGSYVSSTTQPGTFEWKEGVLIRAMRQGKWVVLEDIDRGSNEVLGILKPLVESLGLGKWIGQRASLEVPGRGRVTAADGFAIFATRSVHLSRTGSLPPPLFFGAHKFHEIHLTSPTSEELQIILDSRFPPLKGPPIRSLIHLWDSLKALGSTASTRDIGLRELDKFCSRVSRLLPSSYAAMEVLEEQPMLSSVFTNPALREDIYLEARDVFFGTGATTSAALAHLQSVGRLIAQHLSLDEERSDWVLKRRTPEWFTEKDANGQIMAVRVGRTALPARPATSAVSSAKTRPFAMHRPAVALLSRISTAIALGEPVLLTGETGTGKTSVVTHLASVLRRPLISLNLSHQTESADLVGGFKPIDARIPGSLLYERFLELFGGTFSRRKNEKFETEVRKAVAEGKWKWAVGLWKQSARLAKERIEGKTKPFEDSQADSSENADTPRKKRKLEHGLKVSAASWVAFEGEVQQFEIQHVQASGKFAFGFVEGPLVKALRSGDWVLLDEINLASPETLECISSLLHSPTSSITLTEQGSLEAVPRHPDFRIFACMNPATDVGKKDLPPNIRSRFTEIDVPPPDADQDTLLSIITQYIGDKTVGDKGAILDVAQFYSAVKELADGRRIADGSNHRPHYSMRTLARALTFAADIAPLYGPRRSIWEGCMMAFTMVLDEDSARTVIALGHKHLLAGVRNPRTFFTQEPTAQGVNFVKFGPFYLEKGPIEPDPVEDYIMTPSVEAKLIDLARIIVTRRFPVLIEGPTSSGKTSSVEYLAKRTGHRFVRINNHEHTDIQEYIGSYVSDAATGKLVFKDGLLVRALRNGDWIVLDELNLAPTDVLEALNRLLDDNRELVIPETQEVVRPHPHFMLFATQNPPGLYAGRKILSRAFRNRFLEVHFADVPQTELETILCQRCRIAPSYGKKIVHVFRELQQRRQAGRVFETNQSFATLRDLFRWAGRDAVGYQELAENGYMLLAERARRDDDKIIVKEVIESVMGVKIDESAMYELRNPTLNLAEYLGCPIPPNSSGLIWTRGMQRLFVLLSRALRFNEPVLLVGETGCGKTSVCQLFAQTTSKNLHSLNCHQNTETADLIGGLRPVRNRAAREADVCRAALEELQSLGVTLATPDLASVERALQSVLDSSIQAESRTRLEALLRDCHRIKAIFEWHDGPLVEAMHSGDVFLLDEISLADDSVLERLNSVLEPARSLVLAERGGDDLENPTIVATPAFKLVATMNPGGDYGKKELSPALRNRFTEIWVPAVDDRCDLELIVERMWKHDAFRPHTTKVLDFADWLSTRVSDRSLVSLRDILAWVEFSNAVFSPDGMSIEEIFHHAANMTFLDGLASLPQLTAYSSGAIIRLKAEAQEQVKRLAPLSTSDVFVPNFDAQWVQLGTFAISKGPEEISIPSFNLRAPTSQDNAMRVVRALQVRKPILLEGSPGVGKTSLVTALAQITGHRLCRINLSEQTDLADLFGADLPATDGDVFAWKDAEFLTALQQGDWVLLDEMNLAPQAVLEGLNAVLDHRGTVYIPELSRSFARHPEFRIFAAQNPLSQGGGRKGLPKSFVNRFTKVYVEELSPSDLLLVCQHLFPVIDTPTLQAMIAFNSALNSEVSVKRAFGHSGSPWEFNLRDVLRWASLLEYIKPAVSLQDLVRPIYLDRFREPEDRRRTQQLFDHIFQTKSSVQAPSWAVSAGYFQIGSFHCARRNLSSLSRPGRVLKAHLAALESLAHCVSQSWLAIVTGGRDSGKTELIRLLADISGVSLRHVSLNHATDTMDILGSFEQVEKGVQLLTSVNELISIAISLRNSVGGSTPLFHLALQQLAEARQEAPSRILEAATAVVDVILPLTRDPDKVQLVLSDIREISESRAHTSHFKWVDGPLVRAIKEGEWIVLDGANLCSPSVLDRLNSLCEPNGFITLSERGFVDGGIQVLRPHPDFRIFMTVDPQYGELSRAMRNRGIEIFLEPTLTTDDLAIIQSHRRLPDRAMDALIFDGIRRGSSVYHTILPDTVSAARVLDHDSTLSAFLDYPLSFEPSPAYLHFLARSIPPRQKHLISRIMSYVAGGNNAVVKFVEQVPTKYLKSAIVSSLNAYADLGYVPSDFVASQPFILSLKESTHPLLPALDLDVAVYLHSSAIPFESKMPDQSSGIARAANEIAAVVAATENWSIAILQNLPSYGPVAMRLASTVIAYANELRQVLIGSHFDYSVVHVVAEWLVTALEHGPPDSVTLGNHAKALQQITSLSSGLGIKEIWNKFSTTGPIGSVNTKRLDQLASHLKDGPTDTALRHQCFNVMSLSSLSPSHSGGDDARLALTKLAQDIEIRLEAGISDQILARNSGSDLGSLAIQLGILSRPYHDDVVKIVERLVQIECSMHDSTLLPLIGYQHLAWTLDALRDMFTPLLHLQMQWMDEIWTSGSEEGPAMLFRPFQLRSVLTACDTSGSSLAEFPYFESRLKREAQLSLLQSSQIDSRLTQMTSMMQQSIALVCRCFVDKEDVGRGTLSELQHFMDTMDNQPFRDSVTNLLRPNLEKLTVHPSIATLGSSWVALSHVIFDLFVPDAPIDPAAMQNFATKFWKGQETLLTEQISLHSTLEQAITGRSDNIIVQYLEEHLNETRKRLPAKSDAPERHDVSRLHLFWAEVVQFRTHVVTKASALIETLNEQALLRENVLQESMAGFCQRLVLVYPDFADLGAPLKFAVLCLRLGLRLITSRTQSPTQSASFPVALVTFPSVHAATSILALPPTSVPSGVTPFKHILIKLAAASKSFSLDDYLPIIESLYAQAQQLWSLDCKRRQEEEEASNSLYRRKDHQDHGDAEMEAQEFLSLFPSFEDVLDTDHRIQRVTLSHNASHVQPADIEQLTQLHLVLFGNSNSDGGKIFDLVREESVETLLETKFSSLPDALDGHSSALQLALLSRRLSSLQTRTGDTYDFYSDSNIVEAKKATAIVKALKTRLQALINQWPDQMVLHHLLGRCDTVLSLHVGSPVAKVLSALEQLLLQTSDWEIYSNRHNTLKDHQTALTNLIVDWRRMELSCWNSLLESQARAFESNIAEWWFHLYNATVRGSLEAVEQELSERSIATYLASFIPLLDEFLRSSPLGQFKSRMQLMRSFEGYCKNLAILKSGAQRDMLSRIARVLNATCAHFDLFSATIAAALSDQRSALEKEVRGFIKLASWKDVNVQALKASAQRTHHQLYKLIRKFRDVLRQPVTQLMHFGSPTESEAKESINDQIDTITFAVPTFPDAATQTASHLTNLPRTFNKFSDIISNVVQHLISTRPVLVVDDFVGTIIVTNKALSAEVIPNVPPERKVKLQKALTVRKRKAWSDLMKELKRVGFSSTLKPHVLARQSEVLWLREQPQPQSCAESFLKIEDYFNRLSGLLPSLRSALSNHHPDLITRDLQKGIMFVESVFSFAMDSRTRLSAVLVAHDQLERMCRRLRLLTSCPHVKYHGQNLLIQIRGLHRVYRDMKLVLDETKEGINNVHALQSEPQFLPLIAEMDTLGIENSELCDKIKDVLENVTLSLSPILLHDEQLAVELAVTHLKRMGRTVDAWISKYHSLNYLLSPVKSWIESRCKITLSECETTVEIEDTDTVIDMLLVHVQSLVAKTDSLDADVQPAERDGYIEIAHQDVRNFTRLLKLEQTVETLDRVIIQLAVYGGINIKARLDRFLPFVELYLGLAQRQITVHCQWTKALFKLDYVLCSITSTISKDGFCQPPDGEAEGAGGEVTDSSGGVGLGSGDGTQNVSKEIEEESQVEGMKGDQDDQSPQDRNADDDAIEMSEDIGGDLEDIPDDEKEQEEPSDKGSDVDPEEQLGDLDASDPSAVDEKLWGDEQGPQDSTQKDDKTNKDHSQQQSDQSEIVAKEGEKPSSEKEKQEEGEQTTDPPATEPEDETEEHDDGRPDASGAPMEDYMQDADTLDLPDDIDLGNDQEDPTPDGDMDMDDVADDEMMDNQLDQNHQNELDPPNNDDDVPDSQEDVPMPSADQDQTPVEDQPEDPDEDMEPAVAQPDTTAGEGDADPDSQKGDEIGQSSSTGQAGGTMGAAGQQALSSEEKTRDEEGTSEAEKPSQQDTTPSAEADASGTAPDGSQEGQAQSQFNTKLANNPLRSLGDALKEVLQRFNEISEATDASGEPPKPMEDDSSGQLEYLRPDDDDPDQNQQALGPAGEEQVANLNDLTLVEETPGEPTVPMDLDSISPKEEDQRVDLTAHHWDNAVENSGQDVEVADDEFRRQRLQVDSAKPEPEHDHNVEVELRKWQESGGPSEGASHMWRLYESLTHDLAYALCEQLRLILEPTLATRLKGDYRTGKRLNMKKIIPYIASDYTKDKIWLRRTRPSQREYQILISLDDSKSMAESHSVHLAFQTLALVAKSLTRLEAGDIAIAKFGQSVDILHGFDEGPFTDQAGTKLMNAFRFDQTATNMLALVDTSLRAFEAGRERRAMGSATAADLWQLQIIISDGVWQGHQSHDKLKTLLRQAEERRVMIVFIIVDSLRSAEPSGLGQRSILKMEKAEYKNVGGRMELHVERYLDSFPFEQYLVLRNVDSLPDVLSTTLRQFFERLSGE
ncbi:Midasin [Mycena indigotica]|uniref:Midasin n=1 Tax=Mycena indigotica TaxID=2126181 RepID=A0A8H6T108_9AGAR|nr:Midasin [Mycena indigotica]KAF7309703.1 Midasin [Mycena indigotica]